MKIFKIIILALSAMSIPVQSHASALSDYLWVPCFSSNNVYKINVVTHEVAAIIPVGEGPSGIAVGRGMVYVTCRYSSKLYCISKLTDTAVDSFDLSPAMAFGIGVALDAQSRIYVVGRANEYNYAMDLAKIAKLSRSGAILGQADLIDIQADDGFPEIYQMYKIGIAIAGSQAFIPWARSWDVYTGIIVLKTDDLSFINTEFYPRTYGYRGPGAAYDYNGNGWSSGDRAGLNFMIAHSVESDFNYFNIGSWYMESESYGDVAVDDFGNIWTGNLLGYLIKFVPEQNIISSFDQIDKIKGIAIDKYGYIWAALVPANVLRKFDADGNQVGTDVPVGDTPLGFGDMTGHEFGRALNGIDEPDFLPQEISISAIYPNPFNSSTTIVYEFEHPTIINLSIYDILGEKVTTLASGFHEPGQYKIKWNAGEFSSGLYFARLESANHVENAKILLLK